MGTINRQDLFLREQGFRGPECSFNEKSMIQWKGLSHFKKKLFCCCDFDTIANSVFLSLQCWSWSEGINQTKHRVSLQTGISPSKSSPPLSSSVHFSQSLVNRFSMKLSEGGSYFSLFTFRVMDVCFCIWLCHQRLLSGLI